MTDCPTLRSGIYSTASFMPWPLTIRKLLKRNDKWVMFWVIWVLSESSKGGNRSWRTTETPTTFLLQMKAGFHPVCNWNKFWRERMLSLVEGHTVLHRLYRYNDPLLIVQGKELRHTRKCFFFSVQYTTSTRAVIWTLNYLFLFVSLYKVSPGKPCCCLSTDTTHISDTASKFCVD